MGAALESMILPTLQGVGRAIQAEPLLATIYFALSLAVLSTIGHGLWRNRPRQVFWAAVAMVLLNTVISAGDDGYTHAYRIAALSEAYGEGRIGMILATPGTGQALPTFVFYGVLPYLPGALLDLAGLPAWIALRIALCAQFLVMAVGLQVLLDRTRPVDAAPGRVTADYLIATLFVLANYVFTLWSTRNALAELWVYSFIPWVVLAILRPGSGRMLVLLFFLQAVSHPIVLAQALVCELAIPYCLSTLSWRVFVQRWLGPLAIALVLAVPFWLPQVLWKDLILGPGGLPGRFEDSFRPLLGLVHGRDFRSIGPWLPLAMVTAVIAARGRLDGRFWIASALGLAVLMLQWSVVSALVAQIPVLNLSVFVWRLMLPAAFLAFGAALVGWRQLVRPPVVVLLPLVALSALAMQWAEMVSLPGTLPAVAHPLDDRTMIANFGRAQPIYGVREFLPQYRRLPVSCPPADARQRVSFDDLRRGVVAERPYLVLREGPIGFVDYVAPQAACGADLVLGPVRPGETMRVSERLVALLFGMRMSVLAALCAFILFAIFRSRRPA